MAIEGADSRQTGHSYRVAEMACQIGRQMGITGTEYRNLYYAALLHDVGMLAVHDLRYLPNVLSKTIERTPEKLHTLVGAELMKNIRLLAPVAPIILHHHEHFDGTGHPYGLVGDDIPLASRIICLAEYLDELRMRGRVGKEFETNAARLATEGSGTKFDPRVVDAYTAIGRADAA
jgi:HD-GYP domain-containing protein (c-di-GMP phosphodiesterase class II)